jgi:hypothetical protein
MTARNAVFFLVICALVCIGPQSATRAAAAHLKRLPHPLTGSTTWVEYDGSLSIDQENLGSRADDGGKDDTLKGTVTQGPVP